MKKFKIIVFSPNPKSLYTLSLCELLKKNGYEIEMIIVIKFTVKRFIKEFKRDKFILFKKIWKKLLIGEKYYDNNKLNIASLRIEKNLMTKNLNDLSNKIMYVNSFNDVIIDDAFTKNKFLGLYTGGEILREELINQFHYGIINCHMGILPDYPGMDLPEWAILNSHYKKIGLTTHFISEKIDSGKILKTKNINLNNFNKITELRDFLEREMVMLMFETVCNFFEYEANALNNKNEDFFQYYRMHPLLKKIVRNKFEKI